MYLLCALPDNGKFRYIRKWTSCIKSEDSTLHAKCFDPFLKDYCKVWGCCLCVTQLLSAPEGCWLILDEWGKRNLEKSWNCKARLLVERSAHNLDSIPQWLRQRFESNMKNRVLSLKTLTGCQHTRREEVQFEVSKTWILEFKLF